MKHKKASPVEAPHLNGLWRRRHGFNHFALYILLSGGADSREGAAAMWRPCGRS